MLDVDATIVLTHSEKENAAAKFKRTFGSGNAGSNTAADHIEVLTDAIAEIPAAHRRKLLVRSDGAGASHDLLDWLTEQDRVRGRSVEYRSFASALVSVDGEEVAPILDKRVRDWIERQTRKTAPISLSTTSTADYATYLSLLDAWRVGDGWSRTRAQVELAIFELSRPSE